MHFWAHFKLIFSRFQRCNTYINFLNFNMVSLHLKFLTSWLKTIIILVVCKAFPYIFGIILKPVFWRIQRYIKFVTNPKKLSYCRGKYDSTYFAFGSTWSKKQIFRRNFLIIKNFKDKVYIFVIFAISGFDSYIFRKNKIFHKIPWSPPWFRW
jgi:hypothetical protein